MKHITYLFLAILFLQGCAGTRDSYTSLIEETNDSAVLRISNGGTAELLAIGNGFPGWWGYYPGVISSAPEVASVDCQEARSAIPFRKPGVIFGGEICTLTARREGTATLYFGNTFTLTQDSYREKIDAIVVGD